MKETTESIVKNKSLRATFDSTASKIKVTAPHLFKIGRPIFIKILRWTKRDIDFFYGEKFATSPTRNKKFAGDMSLVLIDEFNPNSVIDFGCGTGDLLAPYEAKGIEVLGLDGSKECKRNAKINPDHFIVFDLRKRFNAGKKYDMCTCLEVAEHIEEKSSDILINNLASSSDLIIFTAAPPSQEGTDHCNLKPHSWWIDKFDKIGYRYDRDKTEKIKRRFRQIPEIYYWYVDNLLIFKKIQR